MSPDEVATLKCAIGFCDRCRVAIDGGAYIGEWTEALLDAFGYVIAFEPSVDSFAACLERNGRNVRANLWNAALWHSRAKVEVVQPAKRQCKTARQVRENKRGTVDAFAIDDLTLNACDLIKLDLEGAEIHALRGAAATIERFRPILIIEDTFRCKTFGFRRNDLKAHMRGLRYSRVDWRDPNGVWIPC